MVSLLLIFFLTYLFLNEDLLLSDVFKLLTGVLILFAAESLVSRVGDIAIGCGKLVGCLCQKLSIVPDFPEEQRPHARPIIQGDFVSQKLVVRL